MKKGHKKMDEAMQALDLNLSALKSISPEERKWVYSQMLKTELSAYDLVQILKKREKK